MMFCYYFSQVWLILQNPVHVVNIENSKGLIEILLSYHASKEIAVKAV